MKTETGSLELVDAGLCGVEVEFRMRAVMMGLKMYVFINIRMTPSGVAVQPIMTSKAASHGASRCALVVERRIRCRRFQVIGGCR